MDNPSMLNVVFIFVLFINNAAGIGTFTASAATPTNVPTILIALSPLTMKVFQSLPLVHKKLILKTII